MERIDDPSNIPAAQAPLATVNPGHFRRPSIIAGEQGTILTGDWAEDVQEAICQTIEGSGIGALVKGNFLQLRDAILSRAQAVVSANVADDTTPGIVELADQAETEALTAPDRAITPEGLGLALAAIFPVGSANDTSYIILPGVAIQWGVKGIGGAGSVTITFGLEFDSAPRCPATMEASGDRFIRITGLSTTQVQYTCSSSGNIHFIAVGPYTP